ncbi:MAG: 2'-5' RNA ligase family protein [Streptomycetaceae bacterium]|nr:2'-5' RNA ligase family protein [Streptomycetaceae bacterium]
MESFFESVQGRWPAGRVDYHWHILPDPAITRAALVDPYRELTHRQGIAPVPPEFLHITLLHSAPVTEITDKEISDITERVRERCAAVEPFELTLDRPSVGSVAVECLGRPGRLVERLWEITAGESQAVLGDRYPAVPSVHYTHSSLGYATGYVDQRPMRAWITDNDVPPVTFPVTKIALVAQSHDGEYITWTHLADIELAGTR